MADRNGYFQVCVKPDGTYLHIIPPVGDREPVKVGDITDYLSIKDLYYDLIEVDKAVKTGEDITIKLSSENPFIEQEEMFLTISDDGMTAVARFYPPFEGGTIMQKAEIINDMRHRGIAYGADENEIDRFLNERCYCEDIIVARGLPVKEGQDAYIEYMFKTDLSQRPAQNEDGSVDYFNLDNICQCREGEVLARMIPAVHGELGKNVKGEVTAPKIPRNVLFQYGKNIRKSDDGLELISEVNGHVSLVDGKVFVSNVLELSNVDTSTGNIDFDGSVHVEGNVFSGFTVKASGDVEVGGVVEGAEVYAGGQIIIKRGINGMGKGKLEAGSNILSKFIENAQVNAGGYVETDCIIHSTVSAGTHIVVQGKRGFITGGVVRARSFVEAKTLGSDMGVDTVLEVGTDPVMKQRFNDLQKECSVIKKDIARMEPVIRAVGEKLGKGEKLSIDQMKQAKIMSTALAKNKETLKENLVELSKLEIVFDQTTDAMVRVTGQAYPGTRIVVSEVSLTIKKPYHYCRFIRDGADVIMKPL